MSCYGMLMINNEKWCYIVINIDPGFNNLCVEGSEY